MFDEEWAHLVQGRPELYSKVDKGLAQAFYQLGYKEAIAHLRVDMLAREAEAYRQLKEGPK